MTKGHYTHHIDDSGKEPTVIEIKGEPYPEELDPQLHRGNDLAHTGMRIIRECIEAIRGANNSTLTDKNKREVTGRELRKIDDTLTEYEKACGE